MGKKSSMKKSGKKKLVQKVVVVEQEEDEEDEKLDEIIAYVNSLIPQHQGSGLAVYELMDSDGNRKVEIAMPRGNNKPWRMRVSRYNFVCMSYNPLSKIEQAEYEAEYKFVAQQRDICPCQNKHWVCWCRIMNEGHFNVASTKMWIDYMINQNNPIPKLSVGNSKYF